MSSAVRPIQPHPYNAPKPSISATKVESRPSKKRRVGVRVACDACRQKKGSCDGVKPTCGRCRKQGLECVYQKLKSEENELLKSEIRDLQDTLKEYRNFLCQINLESLPNQDALGFLRRLKSVCSDRATLPSLEGSLHGSSRPSDKKTFSSTVPCTPTALEFELAVRHQLAYPTLSPVDTASISLLPLLQLTERLSTVPGQMKVPLSSLAIGQGSSETMPDILDYHSWQHLPSQTSAVATNPLYGPLPVPQYYDSRLHRLEISRWTRISISNELAASTISRYLEVDHPLYGFFDADLFLMDLIQGGVDFCSSLLVNSLLFFASQMFTASDKCSAALSRAFYCEAQILWLSEKSTDSFVNLAAVELLSLGAQSQGRREGEQYLMDGRDMALRLDLFGDYDGSLSTGSYFHGASADWEQARSQAAWGAFNWILLNSTYYRLEPPTSPPTAPIPGECSSHFDNEKDCDQPKQLSHHLTDPTFVAISQLHIISHEVSIAYCKSRDIPVADRIPFDFVERKYRELLQWADSLSIDLARNPSSTIHVACLHILYHCVVLDTFRPFIGQKIVSRLTSFTSKDSSADTVFAASINQLKGLLITLRVQYPRGIWSCTILPAIIQVGSTMVKQRRDPEWRFYFLFCLCLCVDFYVSYAVFHDVMQAFLSMAMCEGLLTPQDSHRFLETLKRSGQHHEELNKIEGTFIIDYELAVTAPDDARTYSLAQRFEELALFSEFTNVGMERETLC